MIIDKKSLKQVERSCKEFVSSIPSQIKLRKLTDQENEILMYRYISQTWNRDIKNFENSLTRKSDSLIASQHVKCVRMKEISEEIYSSKKNDFGTKGVTSPFLWRLDHNLRFPHIISQRIKIINHKNLRKILYLEHDFCSQLEFLPRSRLLAENTLNNFIETDKYIDENNIQIVAMDYNVFTWHSSLDMLNERIDKIKNAFNKSNIECKTEDNRTFDTFLSNLPGASSGFWKRLYLPLKSAISHFNLVTPKKGDKTGIILRDRFGKPICYDPFKYSLDNQHAFIFGPSGSGKSFFNGKMIKDRYYLGYTVLVIDSGGTYRNLFKALKGKYIEYNPEKPLKLNPFLIRKEKGEYKLSSTKASFLIAFISKIWKGDLNKNPLKEVEASLLSKFLSLYYKSVKSESVPTLKNFSKWLKDHLKKEPIEENLFNSRDFFLVLEPFTEGIYKDNFNSEELEYYDKSRLLCFELQNVKNDSRLYPLVVQVLFDFVFQIVESQPTQKKFLDIEEGWTMLDDSSQDYIESFFRKGRKTNTSIRIITQDVDEIKNSKIAGAMRTNAATFILLYNDKNSVRKSISEFLGMNSFDMEKYESLRRKDGKDGFREIFIKEMDNSSVWRIDTSLYEHIILTSRPDERDLFLKYLKEEDGTFDIEFAASRWVEKMAKI